MNQTIETLKGRASIRSYVEKNISPEIMLDILDVGHLSPSAHNLQPIEYIVLEKEEDKQYIKDSTRYGSFVPTANKVVLVISRETKFEVEDGCAATMGILFAAKAYGIGTCWINGKMDNAEKLLKHFLVPTENYKLISIITLGYYDETLPRAKKKDLETLVHYHKF